MIKTLIASSLALLSILSLTAMATAEETMYRCNARASWLECARSDTSAMCEGRVYKDSVRDLDLEKARAGALERCQRAVLPSRSRAQEESFKRCVKKQLGALRTDSAINGRVRVSLSFDMDPPEPEPAPASPSPVAP